MILSSRGTINLVGDIMLQRRLTQLRHESDPGLDDAISQLRDADIVLANLEMPLSRRGSPVPKLASLRGEPGIIDDLVGLNLNAVTMATNHMMDFGPDAMIDTLETCDAAGILHCGAGPDVESAFQPVRLNLRGLRVALINAACTLPIESEARDDKPGIAPVHVVTSYEVNASSLAEQPGGVPIVHSWTRQDDLSMLCSMIARLKSESDIVIVGMHWGVPAPWMAASQGPLAEYQQPLGQALVDAGADIVWGHHTHAPDPIEIYRGKPIFYGLGHFMLEDPWPFMRPESVLVRLSITDPLEVSLVPIIIDQRGLPSVARGDEARSILELISEKSRQFGTRIQVDGDLGVIEDVGISVRTANP